MLKNIAVFFCFILFVFLIKYLGNEPRLFVKEIKMGYTGVVIEKYYLRAIHIKVKIDSNKMHDVAILTQPLADYVKEGDTIVKIPNDNICIIKRDDSIKKMYYVYIPDNVRDDRRWPKEWKDKWIEDSSSYK